MTQEDWYSAAREKRVVFRTSRDRKQELERRARGAGVPLQVYIEAKVLGVSFDEARAPGKQKTKQNVELPGMGSRGDEKPGRDSLRHTA